MSQRRVVISGMGVVSAIGLDRDTFWTNLLQGKSGIGPIERFDSAAFPSRIAAEIKDFNAADYVAQKDARRMDRFVQYACAAARTAVEDSDLPTVLDEVKERTGVIIGSGIGGIETFEQQHNNMLKRGIGGISPFFIPMIIPSMASGQVAIMLGVTGPNSCTVTACASATHAIGDAYRAIQNSKADIMLTGGSEASVTPMAIGGFCAMKALSTRNEEPQKACRPFDLKRDGFVMGEGAGVLVLEEMEHALQRGVKPYAELIGFGCSADAVHMVQPDIEGRGAAAAFRHAIADAGIKPAEVDYINAHGTGTTLNDQMETKAIKDVFAGHSYELAVNSIKAATGHTLGAAGAIELIATVQSLAEQVIPPTLNLEEPDPLCDLDYVPLKARRAKLQIAASDSLGFGGHNAVLIVRKMR
ncbi:beta-ketoacyl-ACP synthase II [Syntrophomonas curvata]